MHYWHNNSNTFETVNCHSQKRQSSIWFICLNSRSHSICEEHVRCICSYNYSCPKQENESDQVGECEFSNVTLPSERWVYANYTNGVYQWIWIDLPSYINSRFHRLHNKGHMWYCKTELSWCNHDIKNQSSLRTKSFFNYEWIRVYSFFESYGY